MTISVKDYKEQDTDAAIQIWNQVVEAGNAFPQLEVLTRETGKTFFSKQSYTGLAYDEDTGEILGLYILHPNNEGRCGHLCNASFAVEKDHRGRGVGETLVRHCLKKGKELGFGVLQLNAVVASNTAALHLYEKLGFTRLGEIPDGFRMKDGSYENIIPHYKVL